MKFNKVITHDTTFHADEVFAVAMLGLVNHDFKLIRTRDAAILAAGIADPNTLVLDVGGVYDVAMLNFDHHQDMSLLSSAGLIYQHFKDDICPSDAQPFFEKFISAIDLIDTNRDNIFGIWATLPSGFRNASSIIGGFNRDVTNPELQYERFGQALAFANAMIDNEIYKAVRKATFETEYANRVILKNNVAVFEEYSGIWKDKEDHIFAVMPHANGWQIQSRDTTIQQIPETISDYPGFIFRHKSGFIAVVKEKDVALSFAETL